MWKFVQTTQFKKDYRKYANNKRCGGRSRAYASGEKRGYPHPTPIRDIFPGVKPLLFHPE